MSGGTFGLEEVILSRKNSMTNNEYLRIIYEIIQSLKEEKTTQELEALISEIEESITAWNPPPVVFGEISYIMRIIKLRFTKRTVAFQRWRS